MKEKIDTCFAGQGVVCGLDVNLNADCSVQVAEGMLILPDGTVHHSGDKKFRYYIKPDRMSPALKKFMLSWLKLSPDADPKTIFLQLSGDKDDRSNIDSLKQQHPADVPEHNLMWNKIMVFVMINREEEDGCDEFWVLVSRNAIAKALKMEDSSAVNDQSLFSRQLTRKEIDISSIDGFLRPVIKLPFLSIPRLGYKQLAITRKSLGLAENNLHHPYKWSPPDYAFESFAQLFFEYKEIIDAYVVEFREALKLLHNYFGDVLSHKGTDYLQRYRQILSAKITRFYEKGEHLYYIQYFYDWLRDLTDAYNELASMLAGFKPGCPCREWSEKELKGRLALLGPVIGGRTTYQPLIFRELAGGGSTDGYMREVRCMHWRLLMMIRTFDLPFLGLEKVLPDNTEAVGIEEKLDSTNYWEYINSESEPHAGGEYNWLPVKFTPTRSGRDKLGRRAIPYYYPLDSNSIYSVHQFWDYQLTLLRRTDTHLSYNAHEGDVNKSSTDTVNDSYSNRPEVLMPLVYSLEPYPWLRPEGYIGKLVTLAAPAGDQYTFYFKSFPLFEYIEKYNLCVDVVAIGLPGELGNMHLEKIPGLEHSPLLRQGYTLVLFFVDSDNEQIELQECRKDALPEIKRFTVVADFILPYRISCCKDLLVKTYQLCPQILP